MTGDGQLTEIADGVYVRRHARLRLTTGLVVGTARCLVIDTRETDADARELQRAIRRVTRLPWTVVNTHGHHDHAFGNATFLPAPIWSHPGAVRMLTGTGEAQRRRWQAEALAADDPERACDLAAVRIVPPTHLVAATATVDLGDRQAMLTHLGRGHTDHDLVVVVPGAAVLAGDLVEEGDPPDLEDGYPLDWPATLTRLLALAGDLPVVPGHGAVVAAPQVQAQQELLATAAEVARAAGQADAPTAVAARAVAAATGQSRAWATLLVARIRRQLGTAELTGGTAPPPP